MPQRFKRHYSRGGCRECKRRKIKCDEAKPFCSECSRLGKECVYPPIGEKVVRGPQTVSGGTRIRRRKVAPSMQMYMGPQEPRKKFKWTNVSSTANSDVPVNNTEPTTANSDYHHNIMQYHPEQKATTVHLSCSSTPSAGELYTGDDLNLLATDLNNIVNDMIFNSNIVPFRGEEVAGPTVNPGITEHCLIGKTEEEKEYVRQFCERFTFQKLPFGVDNRNPGSYRNAIREVVMHHAVKEPFLLAAVLSQGAYSASELQTDEKQRQQDLANCGKYLNDCLRLLVPALSQAQQKQVKGDLTSNIENILLTVLSLAMSNACNEKQGWRPHLKGAKEIIMKATSSKIKLSSTLIVGKLWFADFEILAGLSSELGGTLRTKEEMDLVFNFDAYEILVLKDFGLIHENGFCVVTGYHIGSLEYLRELCDLLRRKRSREEPDPFEYLHLINGLYSQHQVRFGGPLCDKVKKSDGTIETVFWMDLSQQAFTLAGLISVFTRLLDNPPESQHLKGLVTKMIDLIKVFQDCELQDSTRFPFAFLMIQWPISVAGFACTEPLQFPVIENFFEMCSLTGSNSANMTLQRIRKVWRLRETGEVAGDGTESGHVDIISY